MEKIKNSYLGRYVLEEVVPGFKTAFKFFLLGIPIYLLIFIVLFPFVLLVSLRCVGYGFLWVLVSCSFGIPFLCWYYAQKEKERAERNRREENERWKKRNY